MSTVTEVTSYAEWQQLLDSVPAATLLVVSFFAPWAAPCTQMATILSTLASEYPVTEPLDTRWVSVNADELSDISEEYDVVAVPLLVLLRNGAVVESVSGSSAVKVRDAIERHAGGEGKPGRGAAAATTTTTATATTATTTTTTQAQAQAQTSQLLGGQNDAEEDPAKAKERLFKRLGDLVKAAPVMLFMKGSPSSPECGFSRQLVGILREKSVKFGFFNILADDDVRQGLKEFAEWPTFPQLWIDGELVGGLDIVKEEIANNEDFFEKYRANA